MNATAVLIKSGKPRRRPLGTSRTDSGCQKVFWRRACAAPGVRQLARPERGLSTRGSRVRSLPGVLSSGTAWFAVDNLQSLCQQ